MAGPVGAVGRSGLPSACTPVRGWLSGLHASVQRYDDGQHGRSVNEQDASEPLHRRRLSSCTEKPSSCGLHAEAIESAVLVKPYTNPPGDEAQRCLPHGQSDTDFIELGTSADGKRNLLKHRKSCVLG